MKVKKITNRIDTSIKFCDITTGTGNFVLANSNTVIHNSHITSLLMVLFLRLLPELLQEQKYIYRAIMPLYGCNIKGKFKPIYGEDELVKFKNKYPDAKIQRYKGLGEMDPDQLKICLLDKKTRKLELIDYQDDHQEIFNIMTDASIKRKLL